MNKTIILSEEKFSKIFNAINESIDKTIYLQLINGYLYPTNGPSKETLESLYNISRIPEEATYRWFPRLVKDGYKLAINDYYPTPVKGYYVN